MHDVEVREGMLRRTRSACAPVFLQILDRSKVEDCATHIRRGVGFSNRIDLGEGVTEMPVKQFQHLVDAHMRRHSQVFQTVTTGKVTDHMGNAVKLVRAPGKYIVSGQLGGGYVRNTMKYGPRVNGYAGGKLRSGLKYEGDE